MTPPIDQQRRGYLSLLSLCGAGSARAGLATFFQTLPDHNGREPHLTTLNRVCQELEDRDLVFLIRLDWKTEVGEFPLWLTKALSQNFDTTLALPEAARYGNGSISSPHVFHDYDSALRANGFQLGFLDTDADEYILIVHRIHDAAAVQRAVEATGYPYLDASAPKFAPSSDPR